LANANAEHEPELGGPTTARLADALRLYVVPEFMLRRQLPPEVARVVFPAVDMT
jgi:hypothetical protein